MIPLRSTQQSSLKELVSAMLELMLPKVAAGVKLVAREQIQKINYRD